MLADAHFHRAIAALHGNDPCRDALDRVWDRIVLASAHLSAPPRPPAAARAPRDPRRRRPAGDEAAATALAHRHALAAVA